VFIISSHILHAHHICLSSQHYTDQIALRKRSVQEVLDCRDTVGIIKEIDPIATLYYAVVPSEEGYDNGILCGRLEVEIDGWIGLGFSPSGNMANSQAVIGIPDEDTVLKYDLAIGRATPMNEDRQTLRDTSIEIVDGKTTMSFTKLLVEDGEVRIEEEGDNTFLFAWGGSTLGYHMSRKSFTIDLGSTAQTDSPTPEPTTPIEAVETESPTLPPVEEAVETSSPSSSPITISPTPSPTKITPSPTSEQVAPGPAPEVAFISFGESVTISCPDDGSKCCVPDYFASFDNTGDMDVDVSDDNACSSKSSGGTLNECLYEMSCIVTCDPGCSLTEVDMQAEPKETNSPTPSPALDSPSDADEGEEGSTTYQAEDATFDDVELASKNEGYTGSGYADMGDKGSYIEFTNVESTGGSCSITIRYAFDNNKNRPVELMVNSEVVETLDLSSTGDWEVWQDSEAVEAQCVEGSNVIRIVASTDAGGPNIDSLNIMSSTGEVEDSNSTTEPTSLSTVTLTSSPTNTPSVSPVTESPSSSPIKATPSPTVTQVDTTTTTAATEQAVVDPWEEEEEDTDATTSPSSAMFTLEGDFPTEAPGDMTSGSPTQPSIWWQGQVEQDGSDSSKGRKCSFSVAVTLAMFVVSCIGM